MVFVNLNVLPEFSRELRELPQIWAKISRNCANFNSLQKI